MPPQTPAEDLDVPSDTSVVSVGRIKEFLSALPSLGREFSRDAAEAAEETPKGTTLARILSYLKYLGVLEEQRIRDDEGKTIQRYALSEVGKELYYYLESGREKKFGETWSNHLHEHPVFQVVYQHKLSKHPTLTLHELQDFVYEAKNRNVSASYAKDGARFLAVLYADADLVEYDKGSNKIRLETGDADTSDPAEDDDATERAPQEKADLEEWPKKPPGSASLPQPEDRREHEVYEADGIYIMILPEERKIEKARRFLDLVELEINP